MSGKGVATVAPRPAAVDLDAAKNVAKNVDVNSIGYKLLAKMGYKIGQGLGSDGRGIAEPIIPRKRADPNAGINDYDAPLKRKAGKRNEDRSDDEDDDQNDKDKVTKKLKRWKKDAGAGAAAGAGEEDEHGDEDSAEDETARDTGLKAKRKPKRRSKVVMSKSIAQIVAENAEAAMAVSAAASHKIVDMRGPETKVMQDYTAFGGKSSDRADQGIKELIFLGSSVKLLPELRHNLRHILEMTEVEIREIDLDKRREDERQQRLQREVAQLEAGIAAEELQMKRLSHVIELLSGLAGIDLFEQPDAPQLQRMHAALTREYHAEWEQYQLWRVLSSYVAPSV